MEQRIRDVIQEMAVQAAGVYASPRGGRRSRQPKRERSRARTPMWASRLDSLVARRRMVRRVYATRACRRKHRARPRPEDAASATIGRPVLVQQGVRPCSGARCRRRVRRLAMACAVARRRSPTSPLSSQPVNGAARLVAALDGATVMWAVDLGGGAPALLASRYSRRRRRPAGSPFMVETNVAGLGGWHATGDGPHVTVVWKAGASVCQARPARRPHPVRPGDGVLGRGGRGAARRRRDRRAGSATADSERRRLRLFGGSPSSHLRRQPPQLRLRHSGRSRARPRRRRRQGHVGGHRTSTRRAPPGCFSAPRARKGLAVQRYASDLIPLGLAHLALQPVRAALRGDPGAPRHHRGVHGDGGLARRARRSGCSASIPMGCVDAHHAVAMAGAVG